MECRMYVLQVHNIMCKQMFGCIKVIASIGRKVNNVFWQKSACNKGGGTFFRSSRSLVRAASLSMDALILKQLRVELPQYPTTCSNRLD